MGIDKKWNISIGSLPVGEKNLITDVCGVQVGHCTLSSNDMQTGVTALLAHDGNIFQNKVLAACHVINGFGKSGGLVQIEEMGTIETPILLTNTLSVGTAYTALVKYMLKNNPDIGNTTGTVNPVICECNDGVLNDIRAMHVQEEHIETAIKNATDIFEEGNTGAGTGMVCHGLKGGIGSASRIVKIAEKEFTLGALLLTNHGKLEDLIIAGENASSLIKQDELKTEDDGVDKGSVIIILATDAPMSERQLKRISKRAVIGLGRSGSYIANGSGEIAIAFTTNKTIPHYPAGEVISLDAIHDDFIDLFFRAVAECVEESVISSMLSSTSVTGRNKTHIKSLAEILNNHA